MTLDLRAVSSSPTLGVEMKMKLKKQLKIFLKKSKGASALSLGGPI